MESGSLEIITGDNSPDIPPEQRPPRPLSSRCIPAKEPREQVSLDIHEEEEERIRQVHTRARYTRDTWVLPSKDMYRLSSQHIYFHCNFSPNNHVHLFIGKARQLRQEHTDRIRYFSLKKEARFRVERRREAHLFSLRKRRRTRHAVRCHAGARLIHQGRR